MRKIERIIGRRDPLTLLARDLMEDSPVTCDPQSTAVVLAMRLCQGGFGSVPVVQEDRTLAGLVSEYDLLNLIKEHGDLRKTTAQSIMTRSVVAATEDMTLAELLERIQAQHLIRLPVLRGKRLVGIVSRRDLLHAYLLASFQHEGSPGVSE